MLSKLSNKQATLQTNYFFFLFMPIFAGIIIPGASIHAFISVSGKLEQGTLGLLLIVNERGDEYFIISEFPQESNRRLRLVLLYGSRVNMSKIGHLNYCQQQESQLESY